MKLYNYIIEFYSAFSITNTMTRLVRALETGKSASNESEIQVIGRTAKAIRISPGFLQSFVSTNVKMHVQKCTRRKWPIDRQGMLYVHRTRGLSLEDT